MSTGSRQARLTRLERWKRDGDDASDQEHLRLAAAIVLAEYRDDHAAAARLSAQLERLPPPVPGGGLDVVLRRAARLGLADLDGDDDAQTRALQEWCRARN